MPGEVAAAQARHAAIRINFETQMGDGLLAFYRTMLRIRAFEEAALKGLEKVFTDDLVYARRIDPQTWGARGVADRVLEVLAPEKVTR